MEENARQSLIEMEENIRQALVEYGKKLVERGLVQGTWGNISIRLDDKNMLVTPSGLDYERLTPGDMVKVDIQTLAHEGENKPTSEKELHAEIYRNRHDVGAIIHTHSKYACVFAAAKCNMPILPEYRDVFGEELKVGEYALSGSKALAKNTAAALGRNFGSIMANHGMIACGKDIEVAFENCSKIEENGRKYLMER